MDPWYGPLCVLLYALSFAVDPSDACLADCTDNGALARNPREDPSDDRSDDTL